MKAYRVLPERIWQLMGDQTMTATELAEAEEVETDLINILDVVQEWST